MTFSTQTGTMVYANKTSGRSSVWLERYLGVVEAARSSRVAPTKKNEVLQNTAKPHFTVKLRAMDWTTCLSIALFITLTVSNYYCNVFQKFVLISAN